MKVVFSEKYIARKEQFLNLLKDFNNKGETIKSGRNTIKIFKVGDVSTNIKSFKEPIIVNKIIYGFIRKSKAQRSFEYANQLIEKGIGTPFPIAYIEERQSLGLGKSYYFSEHLFAELTYRELVRDVNYPDREKILQEFTAFTFKLHENNILFKDHSPGNTLIKKNGDHYDFYLVDLNRMEFKTLSFEERIKNFSRLTPLKEMVETMSRTYSELSGYDYDSVFNLMWKETSDFQKRFFRKKRLKQKFLFKKE